MEYAVPYWPQIEEIDISRTSISGVIPDKIGNGSMRNLERFAADNTLLAGSLPDTLSFASNLKLLTLGQMDFMIWRG